jgi:hypothetical protein
MLMMSFIAHAGYATAVVDFTNDLSSLLVGIIGATAIAAAMIVVEIIRYQATQKATAVADPVSATVTYQHAA